MVSVKCAVRPRCIESVKYVVNEERDRRMDEQTDRHAQHFIFFPLQQSEECVSASKLINGKQHFHQSSSQMKNCLSWTSYETAIKVVDYSRNCQKAFWS